MRPPLRVPGGDPPVQGNAGSPSPYETGSHRPAVPISRDPGIAMVVAGRADHYGRKPPHDQPLHHLQPNPAPVRDQRHGRRSSADRPMSAVDLAAQVGRAQQGDPAAFLDLVAATVGDLRLYIATYVPTQALGDALLREVYGAIRRELGRCPAQDVVGWMCRPATPLIGIRLA